MKTKEMIAYLEKELARWEKKKKKTPGGGFIKMQIREALKYHKEMMHEMELVTEMMKGEAA
jgi:hypothetical protein